MEKKLTVDDIEVPEGMFMAFANACIAGTREQRHRFKLAAALLWLAENPIVPSDEEIHAMGRSASLNRAGYEKAPFVANILEDFQRRIFLKPEPKLPEAVRRLQSLWPADDKTARAAIAEAYFCGVKNGGAK